MLIAFLAAVISPQLDGARLHPDEACYAIYVPKGGVETVIGATQQMLRRETFDGRPVWHVVVHQRFISGRFDLRDDFILDAQTLRPIRLETTRDGHPHARLDYSPARVTGFEVDKDGETRRIDQTLGGPTWEGDLYGPTFAALPLAGGATFKVPFFQYDRGLGSFTISVQGSRHVRTPEGEEDAWVLDAGPSATERLTYLIAKSDGRELGYYAPEGGQRLGGDCTGIS